MNGYTNSPIYGGGGYSRNYIDNWDFNNPVNQRSQSSYTSAGYTIDRWKIAENSSLSIYSTSNKTDNGIQIKGRMYQLFETFYPFRSERVTLSMRYTNKYSTTSGRINILSGSTWLADNLNVKPNVSHDIISITFNIPSNLSLTNDFQVNIISEDNPIIVHAIKLEIGKESTLKNDILGINYIEEFKKCRRYLYRFDNTNYGNFTRITESAYGHNEHLILATVSPPDNFRVYQPTPSLSYSDLSGFYFTENYNDHRNVIDHIYLSGNSPNIFSLDVWMNSDWVELSKCYTFYMSQGHWFQISAEL